MQQTAQTRRIRNVLAANVSADIIHQDSELIAQQLRGEALRNGRGDGCDSARRNAAQGPAVGNCPTHGHGTWGCPGAGMQQSRVGHKAGAG